MKRSLLLSILTILTQIHLSAQIERVPKEFDSSRRIRLAGHRPLPVTTKDSAIDWGSLSPVQMIHRASIIFKRTAAQQADFDVLHAAQHKLGSPDYLRWLTPLEFADRFGLDPPSLGRIRTWLETSGFIIDDVAISRNWISFSGTAAQFDQMFQSALHSYEFHGEMYFAPSADPTVPSEIESVVLAISGLDDFGRQPHRAKLVSSVPATAETNGRNGLVPADLETIYGIAPLRGAGLDGSGQSIAIIGSSNVQLADLQAYRAKFGLPAKDPRIIALTDPGVSFDTTAAGEAILDLEISAAIAPSATQIFVYANKAEDAIQHVIDRALAPVLSSSFLNCEANLSPAAVATVTVYAAEADVKGISWINASGDSGAAGCDPHNKTGLVAERGLGVNIYAALPEVTGIGGTEFADSTLPPIPGQVYWNGVSGPSSSSAAGYIPETAWNDSKTAGALASSGGGTSILFLKPAWQLAPGVPNDGARDVPDISFSASGLHDAYLTCTVSGCTNRGGTSAGAPLFSGMVALLNQFLVKSGVEHHRGLGNLNPALYSIANSSACTAAGASSCPFHDIQTGDNKVPCATGSPDCVAGTLGYSAAPGYDLVTGLGSLDATVLFTEWLKQMSSNLIATTTMIAIQTPSAPARETIEVTVTAAPAAQPSGTVTLTAGAMVLGSLPVSDNGTVTFDFFASQLPPGTSTITARFAGGAGFAPSSAFTTVTSASTSAKKGAVQIFVSPNPVFKTPSAYGSTWNFSVILREVNGAAFNLSSATLNALKFNGSECLLNKISACSSTSPSDYFGTSTIPAFGSISVPFQLASPAPSDPNQGMILTSFATATPATVRLARDAAPGALTIEFDTPGATLNLPDVANSFTVSLLGRPGGASLQLLAAPMAVLRNAAAPAACAWSQQLMLVETAGTGVTLKHFVAGGTDMSTKITSLWGGARLNAGSTLTASMCWTALSVPVLVNYEIDGTDDAGNTVSAALTSAFLNQPSSPTTFTVASANPASSGTLSLNAAPLLLNVATQSATQVWTVSVFATGQSPGWLTVNPSSGSGPGTVFVASASGLNAGTYGATLMFQSADSAPQVVQIPVSLTVK